MILFLYRKRNNLNILVAFELRNSILWLIFKYVKLFMRFFYLLFDHSTAKGGGIEKIKYQDLVKKDMIIDVGIQEF